MSATPDISVVIPVFDKADVLPHVVAAFAAQSPMPDAEYIFVDDGSADGSAEILRGLAASLPGLRVIDNADNAGPALRTNQGAGEACGRLLCLLDADEIVAPDAIATMARILGETGADCLHGKVKRSDLLPAAIVPQPVGPSPVFAVSDRPLATLAGGRGFVRMAWLVTAALFRDAGGCDPRIFIQDESLPLRLGLHARRFVDLRAFVTTASAEGGHLSRAKAQQHHDRFLASYNLLRDNPELPADIARALARKCFSAAWKAAEAGLEGHKGKLFVDYLISRLPLVGPRWGALTHVASLFGAIDGMRRPPEAP
ncbi:MAG: glycosyltransferase family 2 protein [Alphaproteobacteria bacterium]